MHLEAMITTSLQYLGDEAKAAVAYSVEEIGVSHVFVVGHFVRLLSFFSHKKPG